MQHPGTASNVWDKENSPASSGVLIWCCEAASIVSLSVVVFGSSGIMIELSFKQTEQTKLLALHSKKGEWRIRGRWRTEMERKERNLNDGLAQQSKIRGL